MTTPIKELNLEGKIAVITGGSGVIGSVMAKALAMKGVKTAIISRKKENADKVVNEIRTAYGTESLAFASNVLDKASLEAVKQEINEKLGSIDFLINGAGGNAPNATTKTEKIEQSDQDHLEDTFFGLELDGFDKTFALNFQGTLLPSMVFATDMVKKGNGVIVNISSMNSYRPLTRIPAYSASKAAINNFTQWLAVHFAKTGVRVNAIAPGFLLTNQNRFLLVDEKTGEPTSRGQKIMNGTPMERYGTPEELSGALTFLLSDWSEFITGIIIPVDGGFSAYSGV